MKTDHSVNIWTQWCHMSLSFVRLWTETRKNWMLSRRSRGTAARRRLFFVTRRKEESRQQMARRRRCTGSFSDTRSRTLRWSNCLQSQTFVMFT